MPDPAIIFRPTDTVDIQRKKLNQLVAAIGGGSAAWGDIDGTLADQLDLQAALDGKVPSSRLISTTAPLSGGGALSGDMTLSLADTAVTPATYGDATHVPQFTVDQKGRLTAASSVAISAGGGLVQIAKQDLNGVNTFTFSSIPAGYTDLELVIFGRSTAAVLSDQILMRVNGLSTAIYDMQRLYAQSNSTATADQGLAQTTANPSVGLPGTSVTNAGFPGHYAIQIFGYSQTTLHKSFNFHGRQINHATSGNAYTISGTGCFRDTNALASITIYTTSGSNFASGSYAVLRGLV